MEYDAVLGMDWLSMHHAHVDCHHKRVTFKMKEIPEFTFEGVRNRGRYKSYRFLRPRNC